MLDQIFTRPPVEDGALSENYLSKNLERLDQWWDLFKVKVSNWSTSTPAKKAFFKRPFYQLFITAAGVSSTPLFLMGSIRWLISLFNIISGEEKITPIFFEGCVFLVGISLSWYWLVKAFQVKDKIEPQKKNHSCIKEIVLPSNVRTIYKTDKEVEDEKSRIENEAIVERNNLVDAFKSVATVYSTLFNIKPGPIHFFEELDRDELERERKNARSIADEFDEDLEKEKIALEKIKESLRNKRPTDVTDIKMLDKIN